MTNMPQIIKNFGFGKLGHYALIVFILIVLFCNQCAHSQQVTWYKILNGPYPTVNDYGYASCRADRDNLYVLGSISNARIYLLKLNALGDTIWTKVIGNDFSRGRAIVESDSGSCVLTGDIENGQAFAMKISKTGSIIWEKYYGGTYTQLLDIKKTRDKGYVMCGRVDLSLPILLKLDSLGNLEWSKTYNFAYVIVIHSIVELESSGYLLTGWRRESSASLSNALVLRVDSNGNRFWDTVYNLTNSTLGRKIVKTPSGYVVCGEYFPGKLFCLSLDSLGKIVSTHIFDSTYYRFDIGDVKYLDQNRFLMNFSQDSGGISINGKIMIFDLQGNETILKTYSSKDQLTFGNITQLADSGFVFCGTIDNDEVTNRDIFVNKTDTSFNSNPVIGIETSNDPIPTKFSIKNYPNPFNPQTTIRIDVPKDAIVSVRIYDLLGREVYSVSGYQTAGTHELKFDGSNFASGMYFYSVETNGFKETKKMVLLK